MYWLFPLLVRAVRRKKICHMLSGSVDLAGLLHSCAVTSHFELDKSMNSRQRSPQATSTDQTQNIQKLYDSESMGAYVLATAGRLFNKNAVFATKVLTTCRPASRFQNKHDLTTRSPNLPAAP
jgi:hypothetical protein